MYNSNTDAYAFIQYDSSMLACDRFSRRGRYSHKNDVAHIAYVMINLLSKCYMLSLISK